MKINSVTVENNYIRVNIKDCHREFVYPMDKFSSEEDLLKEIAKSLDMEKKCKEKKEKKSSWVKKYA